MQIAATCGKSRAPSIPTPAPAAFAKSRSWCSDAGSGGSAMLNRRAFLLSTAAALGSEGEPKRIAAVVTEYRPNSHADVIIGKYLDGFRQDGRPPRPRSRIVSLYTAQVPANDLSRERAAQHGVPIFPTIAEALTLGKGRLGVDGVLLIGEHGDYPTNEKGQKLY